MAKYFDLPVVCGDGKPGRLLVQNESLTFYLDSEGKVFLNLDIDNCFELDVHYEEVLKAMREKRNIATLQRLSRDEGKTLRIMKQKC